MKKKSLTDEKDWAIKDDDKVIDLLELTETTLRLYSKTVIATKNVDGHAEAVRRLITNPIMLAASASLELNWTVEKVIIPESIKSEEANIDSLGWGTTDYYVENRYETEFKETNRKSFKNKDHHLSVEKNVIVTNAETTVFPKKNEISNFCNASVLLIADDEIIDEHDSNLNIVIESSEQKDFSSTIGSFGQPVVDIVEEKRNSKMNDNSLAQLLAEMHDVLITNDKKKI
jgi:hypothetical protein